MGVAEAETFAAAYLAVEPAQRQLAVTENLVFHSSFIGRLSYRQDWQVICRRWAVSSQGGCCEDGEMNDGYAVRYCNALAGEITTLTDTRASGKTALSKDRFLPETLAAYPIVAATPVKDGEWASIVAWTIQTLLAAEAQETKYSVGGIKALPVAAPELGLAPDWQERLIKLVGTNGDLYDRNLGDKSELEIPRGLNASVADGGALDVLHTE